MACSSSLHVPYRITEFATYHNRVRYLYLYTKFKPCGGEVVGAITWQSSSSLDLSYTKVVNFIVAICIFWMLIKLKFGSELGYDK